MCFIKINGTEYEAPSMNAHSISLSEAHSNPIVNGRIAL